MKGQCDIKYPEMRGTMSNCEAVVMEPDCKRLKPDVLMEMGLAMLDDDDEPLSAGDSQTAYLMHSPYNTAEIKLLSSVNEDVSSFADPFGDDFLVFRRQKSQGRTGEDHFSKLSDEIVLSVFRWLPKKTLKQCALVSRRWRNIARDEELWTRLDLGTKTLCPGNLADVLRRGVRILRLAQCDIPDPVFGADPLPDDYVSRLNFLDLSLACISEQGLLSLMKKTKYLIKLSLEHCVLNDEICEAISQNSQLEVLNLTMVYNLTANGLRAIISKCRRIVALNLGWTGLTIEAVDSLMSCLPPNLSQLNISGCRQALMDKHIVQLVRGCPKLTELDISDATLLSTTSIDAVSRLENLEHLAISRCYHISAQIPSQKLEAILSLRFLDLFGLVQDNYLPNLKKSLPNLKINQFPFSSIARPTVGVRRTSIWELRVRDSI
ncbi:hypothetical protein ONE63_002452 [Megalurothrips usitatus]|uniref:F-box domain-containing protein n=1 Tax=Megalurothrips usitatus TaxID=439358 RepID=A0AAV7XEX4_9NEOP|nr:hypothetical protein ONE63_002452 [Megalurothrips usitatus]